ncbi:MAG TPA: ParA family protein [Gemmatirosa sp.]
MHVITVSTGKGGDAKTRTVIELAAAFAERGARVGVVDGDSQQHATQGLGIAKTAVDRELSTYAVFARKASDEPTRMREAFVPSSVLGVRVLAAEPRVGGLDRALVEVHGAEMLLREMLAEVADDFDVVLIDLSAHPGTMTANAYIAASHLIVPSQLVDESVDGALETVKRARLVAKRFGHPLEVLAIIPTKVPVVGRTRDSRALETQLRQRFGALVTRPVRATGAPPSAFARGIPVLAHARSSATAQDYLAIAGELAERIGLPVAPVDASFPATV